MRQLAKRFALGLCLAATSHLSAMESAIAQTDQTASIGVCLASYNATTDSARYRVTINWKDTSANFARIDIGVKDGNDTIWPQLRDPRLRPSTTPTTIPNIVVSHSVYPLTFELIGLTDAAKARMEKDFRDGFFGIDSTDGVSILSQPIDVIAPDNHPRCS